MGLLWQTGHRILPLQACARHGTAPTASAALGRLLMGALLLAAFREEQATTQVSASAHIPFTPTCRWASAESFSQKGGF